MPVLLITLIIIIVGWHAKTLEISNQLASESRIIESSSMYVISKSMSTKVIHEDAST